MCGTIPGTQDPDCIIGPGKDDCTALRNDGRKSVPIIGPLGPIPMCRSAVAAQQAGWLCGYVLIISRKQQASERIG
jgi:hypothetical protein